MNKHILAITAAKNYRKWGRWAAFKFITKNEVPLELYYTALRFETRRKVNLQLN
jgi:hypothetical protein